MDDITLTTILYKYKDQQPKQFGEDFGEKCYPVSAILNICEEYHQMMKQREQKETEQQSNCNLPQVSNRYEVRDWMGGQLYVFDNYDDAKKKYDEIYKDTHNDECDIQLYNVLHDFSNIEEQK